MITMLCSHVNDQFWASHLPAFKIGVLRPSVGK